MKRDGLDLARALVLCLPQLGEASAPEHVAQSKEAEPAPLAKVPFIRAHGLIFVTIERASGAPVLALLDTGATASAIDTESARELPVVETVEVVGTTGSLRAETVALRELRLARFSLPELRATRRDLGGLLAPGAEPVRMILGSDAFAGRALTLDFGKNELEVAASFLADRAQAVPMPLDLGIPTLGAAIGGVEASLRIDTGASLFASRDVYVNVPTPWWTALQARQPELAPTTHFQGTGANGETVELPVYRVADALIGPELLDQVFLIVQPASGYFAAPDAKGFVGNNFLEKLGRVTLDYGAQRLQRM